MNWTKLLIVSAALIYSGGAFSGNDDSCKQGHVFLGGLCHSYESLEDKTGEMFNPYDDAKELTPELAVMIIRLMPDEITSFIDSYFGSHVSFMKPDDLLSWDLSVRDYLSYLSYVPVQLDVSDAPEIFILDQSPGRCGAGGCSGYVLDLDSSDTGDILGTVYYTGSVVKPVIGPAPPPESGYYDFAVVGDEGISTYNWHKAIDKYVSVKAK